MTKVSYAQFVDNRYIKYDMKYHIGHVQSNGLAGMQPNAK